MKDEKYDKKLAELNLSISMRELSTKHAKELNEFEQDLSGKGLLNQGAGIRALHEFLEKRLQESLDARIECITDAFYENVAIDEETAISFPKYTKGHYEYWKNGDRIRAITALRKILSGCRLMFQNALYDAYWLRAKGFEVNRIEEDIMLLHHAYHAELPHNLAYINSVYGQTTAWKSEYGKHGVSIFDKEDSLVRTYNCRDVVVLHQILPELTRVAEEAGVMGVYRDVSLKLIDPLIEMQMNGLLIDQKERRRWKKDLEKKLVEVEKNMRVVAELPDEFNFSSTQHQRYLFFGTVPGWYKKKLEEYEFYQSEDCKLKKDTKKYAQLCEKIKVIRETNPLSPPKGFIITKTKGGEPSVDEEVITRYITASRKRMIAVNNLIRVQSYHKAELGGLQRSIDYMQLLLAYREISKMISTYTEYEVDENGFTHPSFKIHGTRTGRFSSGGDQ